MSELPKLRRFEGRKALVTGGGGFLGKALVKQLLAEGAEVVTVQRQHYPELAALGVAQFAFDISDPRIVNHVMFQGVTDIFHTAAKVEMWGNREDFYRINVIGTQNLLHAAKLHQVPRFIFTSSPSVIASGKNLQGVDEAVPYPDLFHAYYPETKAIAEQCVIAEGSADALQTIVLRPHLIYGPGDTSLEALIVKKAKAGRLVRVGAGSNLADFCHIDDCVAAHLCAASTLAQNSKLSGRVYFISQGEPIPLWKWIDAVLLRHGLPPVKRQVSAALAIKLGIFFEWLSKCTRGLIEPPFTRFLAEEMSTDHYFNITAARRDLGFQPITRDMFHW